MNVPIFQNNVISVYNINQSFPKFRHQLQTSKTLFKVVRVLVSGMVCGHHHRKIVGCYDSGNGQTYHDDGWCSERDRCWSEEGELTEKRLIIFHQGPIPRKHRGIMDILLKEYPDPKEFRWSDVDPKLLRIAAVKRYIVCWLILENRVSIYLATKISDSF